MKLLNLLISSIAAMNPRHLMTRGSMAKRTQIPVVKYKGHYSSQLLQFKNFMESGPFKAQFDLYFDPEDFNHSQWK